MGGKRTHENVSRFIRLGTGKKRAAIYSAFGAVPACMEQVRPHESILRNISERILARNTFLHNEVEFLLREEIREPRDYYVFLRLHDRFFASWFKYVLPNRGRLEIGNEDYVLKQIEGISELHLGDAYESIAREIFLDFARREKVVLVEGETALR